jgi:hypothetical protein
MLFLAVSALATCPLRSTSGSSQPGLRAVPASGPGFPAPRYVEQPLDHFNASQTRTWQQAYYVNDTFWDGTGPVFVCVGGEGPPIDGSAVVSSVHCNNAVEFLPEVKGLMFAVEHRYYGCHNASACPYTPSDPQPLKWLSSRQALADLANFHAHATAAYSLSSANKWVSFGGSYPGMLAGWFRVMYPDLVHASVSSSAPVIAKLEMKEYNDIAAHAYTLASVGGSAACNAAIAEGHATIGTMMNSSSGRAKLDTLFAAAKHLDLTTHDGQLQFAGNGVAYFPSQGNDPACQNEDCDIAKICATMNAGSDNVASLAAVAKASPASAAALSSARPAERSASCDASPRTRGAHEELDYWGWQTCTEFGFYQTCDLGSNCFYTQGLNLLPDMDGFCASDYGISQAEIAASIAATNAHYGADRPDLVHNATRVMYVNGDVDPWSGLSILPPSHTPALPTLLVSGASHHFWTHPSLPTDEPPIVAARQAIRQQVKAWLAVA